MDYQKEARIQKKLWENLKRWLRVAISLSTILVALLYALAQISFPYDIIVTCILTVIFIVDCIWMVILGKALYQGHKNIEKLLSLGTSS